MSEVKEVPINNGETVGLMERPFSGRVRGGIHIPAQPLDHMGVAKIVRERALEDIMGGKAQEVLRQFRETPERQPLLKDEKFQYWLKQVGVLQTYSESSEEMQALRKFAVKIGMKKKITQTEQLFLMMMSRMGRLSSTDRYTDALEGDRWDLENPEEGGMIEIARQKFILQQKLKDERGDLRLGATICNIHSLGLGIGIRSFGLDHQEVSVLYRLYLNKGKLIPSTVLTSVLSRGREKEMVNPINSLQVYISKIRKKAAKLGYLFEIKTERGLGYMLSEKKLPEKLQVVPEEYSSSEKEFSAWLGQQIEEISAAEDVLLKPQVSPEGQSSSQKEFQDWLGRMNVLQTQRDPGGRNFVLSPQETSLLYYLYLTRGRWVSANRLFSALPREGKKMEVADLDNYISTYIKNIRKKAAERGYLFEIKTEKGLGYMLDVKGDENEKEVESKGNLSSSRLVEEMSSLERFQATPEPQPFLDKEFQDWLELNGILKRLPKDLEAVQSLRNMVGVISMKKKISLKEQLFVVLMSEEGYFISLDRLNTVFGRKIMGRLPLEKFRLQQQLKQRLGHLMTNNISLYITRVGIGIGLQSFGLSHQEMYLLYRLYQNYSEDPERWISDKQLISGLLRRGMEAAHTANNLQVCIYRLRKLLNKPGALFEIQNVFGKGYKLVKKKPTDGRKG